MGPRFHSNLARVFFSLIALVLPAVAFAQAGSGELTGEVRDPAAGLVANAQVTLTQVQTGLTYTSATTTGGIYVFSSLKPGLYTLTVEAPGFKRFVREDIAVATGERVHVDVALTVGSVTDATVLPACSGTDAK